ncbi:MAG: type II toxin-antitoxin system RelB/DinJ family antitoxin [Coriobacteriaceae bacterium]|nr:type II toxin-antitoxin system RelB/DinJ family antitoxin [Coriobacteriaceae bacterium]
MDDAMVTGRMDADKKARGNRILQRDGLSASQAINLMYDRLIQEGNAEFLAQQTPSFTAEDWQNAADFIDSLSLPLPSRFDTMTKAEIRMERLKKRGLV